MFAGDLEVFGDFHLDEFAAGVEGLVVFPGVQVRGREVGDTGEVGVRLGGVGDAGIEEGVPVAVAIVAEEEGVAPVLDIADVANDVGAAGRAAQVGGLAGEQGVVGVLGPVGKVVGGHGSHVLDFVVDADIEHDVLGSVFDGVAGECGSGVPLANGAFAGYGGQGLPVDEVLGDGVAYGVPDIVGFAAEIEEVDVGTLLEHPGVPHFAGFVGLVDEGEGGAAECEAEAAGAGKESWCDVAEQIVLRRRRAT